MEPNQEFRPIRSKYLVITAEYLIPVLVVISALFLWWLIFYTSVFALKHIECELDFEPCQNASLLAEIDKYKGENLIRLDEAKIKSRLTSADFTLRAVRLTKHLPDSLTLSLESVYPVVAARLRDNSTWIIFDDRLRVIGTRAQDPNVPTVIIGELKGILVGAKIDNDELNTALTLARNLSAELSGLTDLELVGSTITLTLGGGLQAIMTTTKDVPLQIRTLQAVLANATMLSGVNIVDVRFNQPVLK